jgi:hypothetical protein
LFDPAIADHRGRIVKTTGDGALVVAAVYWPAATRGGSAPWRLFVVLPREQQRRFVLAPAQFGERALGNHLARNHSLQGEMQRVGRSQSLQQDDGGLALVDTSLSHVAV